MNIEDYELKRYIAQGCLTNSKHSDRFVQPYYPKIISHGIGPYLYDIEGKEYIDFICGLGANVFGYNNPEVESIADRPRYGCYSLPTIYEIELARKITQRFPFIEKMKFVNDGSSGCIASILMAKRYKSPRNKDVILSEGYHGWHPLFQDIYNRIPSNFHKEVPKDLEKIDSSTAAIIIEPIQLDHSIERREYLKELREFCTKNGIILIFDETITSLRFELGLP